MVRKGFTLVELMIVILIVAILAAVAIPLMTGRIDAAKWSEAKATMGTIATSVRAYYAEKGCDTPTKITVARGGDWTVLGLGPKDLEGTYFGQGDYQLVASNCSTGAGGTGGLITYTITAFKSSTKENAPSNPTSITMTCEVDGTGTKITWSDGTRT